MEKETYKKAKEILEKFATVSELCRHNFITSCHFFVFIHMYYGFQKQSLTYISS